MITKISQKVAIRISQIQVFQAYCCSD